MVDREGPPRQTALLRPLLTIVRSWPARCRRFRQRDLKDSASDSCANRAFRKSLSLADLETVALMALAYFR
jgi:hypothetical protein